MGKVVNKPMKTVKKKINKVVSAQLKKQIKTSASKRISAKKLQRGIVLVKHLPNNFNEPELKTYFQQFGRVTRLRLARSERTGVSKGYAYIEFQVPEVAEIAAASMDNYLMFKKLVKSVYIPPAEQKNNYFRRNVRFIQYHGKLKPISRITRRQNEAVKKNNLWTVENYQIRTTNSLEKIDKLKAKYSDLGINLDAIIVKPAPTVLKKIEKAKKNNEPQKNKIINKKLANKKLANKKLTNKKLTNKNLPNKKLPNKNLPNKKLPNKNLANKKLTNKKLPNKKLPNKEIPKKNELKNKTKS